MSMSGWSTTPVSNASVGNINMQTGAVPSTVHPSVRQLMADVRAWYETAEFRDLGDVPTYASASSFTLSGNLTARYAANRRIQFLDNGATLYGTISSSSYAAPNTTVNVTMDSGVLDANLTNVALGLATQDGLPATVSRTTGSNMTGPINYARTTVASATTPDIWTGTGNNINYTGTATATGFAAAPQAGASRILDCAAAAVFTAGANMLIDGVASGSNLTVAAGDRVEVFARTTTQFVLRQLSSSGLTPGAYSQFTPLTVNTVLTAAQSGGTFRLAVASLTVQLPPVQQGLRYRIWNNASAGLSIISRSGTTELFYQPDGTATTNFTIYNSASAPQYDQYVDVISLDGMNWFVTTSFNQGLINLAGQPSDVLMQIGQTGYIDFSGALSVQLHVATNDGQEYEIKVNPNYAAGSATTGMSQLLMNNTTYGTSWQSTGIYNGTANSTAQGVPILTWQQTVWNVLAKVCTRTAGKSVNAIGMAATNTGTYSNQVENVMTDTTTPWTSLGTVTFPVAHSGRILVTRIA